MTSFLWFFLMPLVVVWAVLTWVTETRTDRVKRYRAKGYSYRQLSEIFSMTPYQVKKILAT